MSRLPALAAALVGVFVLVVFSTTLAQTLTQDERASLIRSLKEQVSVLRAQLAQLQEESISSQTTPATALSCAIERALTFGARGEDVSCLRSILSDTGDYAYPEITGYFGSLTQRAVERYRARDGIVNSGTPSATGYGAVGPMTRASLLGRAGSRMSSSDASQSTGSTTGREELFLDISFFENLLEEGATEVPMDDSVPSSYRGAIPVARLVAGSRVAAVAGSLESDRPPFGYIGDVSAKTGIATGWAYDPDKPGKSIYVHIYIDGDAKSGTFLGSALANKNSPNVTLGKTSYNHWYTFEIPEEYWNGKRRALHVYGIDTDGGALRENNLLKNNPKTFTLSPKPVKPKPSCALTASPDTIAPGASATLSWTTANARSGAIDNGVGSMQPIAGGSKSVSPTQTTTYTSSVTGAGGAEKCVADVTVTNGGADTARPTLSLAAPANNATASGIVSITADASDNIGVAGIQFKVDGKNIGAEDTAAPYGISWDSAEVPNGDRDIRALAHDAAGNGRWSAIRAVTVSNITTRSRSYSFIADPTYGNGIRLRSSERVIAGGPAFPMLGTIYPFGSNGRTPDWLIGRHYTKYPFSIDTPATVLADGSVEYKTPGERVVFGPGSRVVLGVNSIDRATWTRPDGATDNRAKSFLSIAPDNVSVPLIPLTDLRSVRYTATFKLTEAVVVGNIGNSRGAGASGNLRLKNIDPNDPGYGGWVYFIVKYYTNDEKYISERIGRDVGGGTMLYRLASSAFYSGTAHDMKWITIDKDILPMFADAIKEGYKRGYFKSNNVSNYAVSSFRAPHWEMTAPMDVEMEFKDFDVVITPEPTVSSATGPRLTFFEAVRSSLYNTLDTVAAAAASLFGSGSSNKNSSAELSSADVEARIAELERRIAELRARIKAMVEKKSERSNSTIYSAPAAAPSGTYEDPSSADPYEEDYYYFDDL